MYKTLFIFGTRPEAVKLCPVVRYFQQHVPQLDARVCVTAQHRDMLDQVLSVFGVVPHHDLNAMRPDQTLTAATSRILADLEPVLQAEKPDMVVVQGDTATTLCGGLAAFYAGIPVGHIEAGLRTGDLAQPFPEEMNRVVVSHFTKLHFAATDGAASNLRREGIPDASILVTGNTGIDAVLYIRDQLASGAVRGRTWDCPDTDSRKLIVVTAHRRESFGEGFERICIALRRLADRPDVRIVYPVHPNPNVTGPVRRHLANHPNIELLEPLDYVSFVDLARKAYFLITDSGGIQEEAPSLGKPVLVLRDKTERPEAVEAGTALLVGTEVENIVTTANWLLDDAVEYARRQRIHNPYGDGNASKRIADGILRYFAAGGMGS
ncbi:MAG: UDP-N-acetylglucosamine 2-epimerase (non-hydrolyzing) [Acidobacteriota bacterium]